MNRRKFLIGAGSVAAGGAAAIGTGAVETISTDRDFAVDVAGDGQAFLGLDPNPDSQFVVTDSNQNIISLDLSGAAASGAGVNNEGSTEIRPAFTLQNNSSRELYVGILNTLRNNDISSSQTNTDGFSGGSGTTVPAGLDVQFAASTTAPDFNTNEVGLIGRDSAPATGDNFGTPSDPSTFALKPGVSFPYNFLQIDDTGYIRIPSGKTVPVTVRAVTDNFDVVNDSVPDTRFIVNATTSESAVGLGDNITSEINLDSNRY
ncbi:hypothetical protein [Halorubrum ezzemoulense]|uniref:hypothetical protein n=1 Tax=Halorubrum ezzemoulense TaxID=337243 RepID=UPI00114026CB|nr:hypothetical protein [Halorubrum ezzemoulense]